MANTTVNNTPKKPITKIALEPGMKIVLEQNGVPLNAEQLDGKSPALTKSGNSLVVTLPDGSQTELVDFFITEEVTLAGDFWELPADGGLMHTTDGVIARSAAFEKAGDTGVLGEEAIATDADASVLADTVAEVVAETAPTIASGGFGSVLAGIAGLATLGSGSGIASTASLPDTVLSVGIYAGPLITENQLTIAAYGTNGELLQAAKAVELVDGRVDVTFRGDYVGPVLLKVVDTAAGVDYINELDGAAKDLSVDLRAVVQIDGASQRMNVNISPLTELVVQEIIQDAGGDEGISATDISLANSEAIAAANTKIIKALDLDLSDAEGPKEIALMDVRTTVNADRTVATDPNKIGQILAAISGYETKHADGTAGALSALKETISSDAESDVLKGETMSLLGEGARLITVGDATALAQAIDTIAPTVAISSSAEVLKADEIATITFTFSEDPGTTFTWNGSDGDLVVSGGTLGPLSGSGLTRTAIFTPMANVASGTASITVASDSYTDAAGNGGGTAAAPPISFDTLAPTLTITSDVTALKIGETATITFTSSEDPGTTFAWDGSTGDVAVSGGTLSAISGSGLTRTATFTPAANSTDPASITVAGETYTDTAGNTGIAGTTPSITIDTIAPTLTITSDVSTLKADETATITFTFSEDPGTTFTWNGSDGDVTVSGGTLSAISGSGLTRTATFTPTANVASGTASIAVGADYTDAAGNAGVAGTTPSITIDTIAPTVTISSSASVLKIGETATVTFNFSEVPIGFTTEDITIVGGTLDALTVDTDDASIYTAVFTPTAESTMAASITVNTGYADTAGNVGAAGAAPSIAVDTIAPTVAITSSASALKVGETAVITFTFSEAPIDFTAADVAVAGGTLSALTVDANDAKVYTATFTPAANSTDPASITVGTGYMDAVGNTGEAGVTPSITIDTIAPTLAITSDVSILKADETATITFAFSEDPGSTFVWDGSSGDVAVSGGALSAISGSGLTRTAIFTPTADVASGTASITVASDAYTDAAGNGGGTAAAPPISFDTLAPTLTITSDVSTLKADETATITFAFSEDPGTTFAWDGSTGDVAVSGGTLSAISGSGLARTATFTPAVNSTDPASITVGSSYADASGNAGSAGTTPSITIDTVAPTLTITSDVTALKIGETATITFTFSEDPGTTFTWNGSDGDVTVSGGTLSAISGSGLTRTAIFTPTANVASGTASITVASDSYTDAAGNGGGTAAAPSISFDTLAPTLTITSDVTALKIDETATITFTFSEDPGTTFAWDGSTGDVAVSGGALSAISGSGLTRTAVFTPTADVASGTASITVASDSYTDAAGNGGGTAAAPSISFDTLVPTLTITSDVTALKIGETATITFTFSEDPGTTFAWDGTAGDIVVSGGTLSAISGSGLTRTATFTPAANSTDPASITVAGGTYTDTAGNTGIAGTTPSITIDTIAPTLTITSDVSTLKADETATITFTFSEDPGTTFTWNGTDGDVTVSGGTLSAISGSGLTRTATFTPTANVASGTASITVASDSYTDAAGNGGSSGAMPAITFDTSRPTLLITDDEPSTGNIAGGDITYTFTFSDAVTGFTADDINVVGGSPGPFTAVSDTTYTLVVTPTAGFEGNLTVDVAESVATNAAGTGNAGAQSVQPVDMLAPTLLSSTPADNATILSAGSNIVLTFSESIAAGTGNIVISDGAGDTRTIAVGDTSQVTISGTTVTINPTEDLVKGSAYSVQLASGVLLDATGNHYAGIADATTLNFTTPDAAVSLLAIAAGTGGFVINGQSGNDFSGYSVASAGDVDGDGLDDLIVGAHNSDYGAGADSGRSYVVFGQTGTTAIDLSAVAAGTGGFVINGQDVGDGSGLATASAGDINGDGLADLFVGASNSDPSAGSNAGRSYVVFGKASGTAINLSAVAAGTGGFVINGDVESDRSGISVDSAGDVNGDGLVDLIVGAAYGDPGGASGGGRSYVVFGKTGTTAIDLSAVAAGTGGFVINGQAAADFSGISVAGAGDVNGDGLADLIVGAPNSDPTTGVDAGRSYVIFGKTGTDAIDLPAVVAGTGGFVINGEVAGDSSGTVVAGAGDVNGDGLADLIVSASASDPEAGTNAGRSYVVFGKTGTTAIDLSAVSAGTGGFVINGQSAGDSSGASVAAAGDVNGDGLADLLVSATASDPDNLVDAGRTYVVFGKASGNAIDLLAVANGIGGFVIKSQIAGERIGSTVAGAGDFNGDGLADLIVGAPASDPTSGTNAGRSYVIFGSTSGAFSDTAVDQLGTSGADALTGTTAADVLVGGAGNDTVTGSGGADVLYGGSGDDTLVVTADTVAALAAGFGAGGNTTQLSRIDGGSGIDILALVGGGITLDLTAIANQGGSAPSSASRIESIERIDLTGNGNNTLIVGLSDVLDMAGMNSFNNANGWADGTYNLAAGGANGANPERRHQLVIDGDAGDAVSATGWGASVGTVTHDAVTYNVYNQGLYAQLLIDTAVTQTAVL